MRFERKHEWTNPQSPSKGYVPLLTLLYPNSRNIHDNCYLEAVYYGSRGSDYINVNLRGRSLYTQFRDSLCHSRVAKVDAKEALGSLHIGPPSKGL